MTADDELLGQLARRNWVVFAVLLLGSLLWRSVPVTLGVAAGGLVAIAGYHWLYRSLRGLLSEPSRQGARRFKFGYFLRLGALGAVLLILLVPLGVHPLGLAVGLSVVVLSILWTTITRAY